jgi:hypothetical protein
MINYRPVCYSMYMLAHSLQGIYFTYIARVSMASYLHSHDTLSTEKNGVTSLQLWFCFHSYICAAPSKSFPSPSHEPTLHSLSSWLAHPSVPRIAPARTLTVTVSRDIVLQSKLQGQLIINSQQSHSPARPRRCSSGSPKRSD